MFDVSQTYRVLETVSFVRLRPTADLSQCFRCVCLFDMKNAITLEKNKLSVEISTDLINAKALHFNNIFTVALLVDFIQYLTEIQHSKTLRFAYWSCLRPTDGLRSLISVPPSFACFLPSSPQWAMASSFTRFIDLIDAPQSARLLWTNDQLVAESST